MFNLPQGRVSIQGGVYNGKGVGWPTGVDSFSAPLFVSEIQLRWLENAVTQGAFVQTRPGYKTRSTFDTTVSGFAQDWWNGADQPIVHPQMLVRFQPTNGQEQLVFAVSGSVFWCLVNSDGTLTPPALIETFQFNPNADVLVGCRCVQSATIVNGQYANNIAPRNLLVIQDGVNRAGIWDGLVGTHMNPVKQIEVVDGQTLYPEAYNQTRIGLWMAWSGNRLWIASGKNVYASDLNDPTHFTEELKAFSVPFLNFPDDVQGMTDRGTSGTSRSQVVVFTRNSTWTLWSGIQARLPTTTPVSSPGWAFTADFLSKIFDGVGCTAGKSVTVHRGLLYWKSQAGLVLFDSTNTVNSSQNLPPIDNEMAYSKLRVAPSAEGEDLTCAGKLGSYVWWSVPVGTVTSGRRYCAQTQVLDRMTTVVRSTGDNGAFNAGTTGWQGIWTGIRPVEWANVNAGGIERTYALSLDRSGVVRIWEAFQGNRADNGHRIPWYVETRMHPVAPTIFEYANFQYFRLLLDQIYGNLDVVGYWKGLRGQFHELLTTRITATPGSILTPAAPYFPIGNTTPFPSLSPQSRTVISRGQDHTQEGCTSQNVESAFQDVKDHAFCLGLRFTGRGALMGYILFADPDTENTEGTSLSPTGVNEEGFNMVPESGCPYHVDGATPDYIALDDAPQLAFCPFQPVPTPFIEEYVSPA